MSEIIIRKAIRNILAETKGSLPFSVVLREWIKVCVEHGEDVSDQQMESLNSEVPGGEDNIAALRIVLPVHAKKVYRNLAPDTQEWVLKHWKSEEYFAAFISGVSLVTVKSYNESSTSGLKHGFTWIDGLQDWLGKRVGSVRGYLSCKAKGLGFGPHQFAWREVKGADGKVDKVVWQQVMLNDLDITFKSTLVHEFQHWFQESVMFQDPRAKWPMKRSNNKFPDVRSRNVRRVKEVQLHIIKKYVKGVDFTKPVDMAGSGMGHGGIAYKVTDPQALHDSIINNTYRNKISHGEFKPYDGFLRSMAGQDAAKIKDFKEIMIDFLKLPIDDDAIEEIKDINSRSAGDELSSYGVELWLRKQKGYGTWEEYDDQKKNPDGTKKIITISARKKLKALSGEHVKIWTIPKSHIDKKGNYKDKKKPDPASAGRLLKASWVIFSGKAAAKNRTGNTGRGEHWFAMKRGQPNLNRGEWTDRWVEIDAEIANYMQGEIRSNVPNGAYMHAIARSNAEELSRDIAQNVLDRLRRRGFPANLRDGTEKQIKSIAKRVADRLIEITELHPYDEWYDGKFKVDGVDESSSNNTTATPQQFYKTVKNLGWNTDIYGRYWTWISKKAIGEKV